MAKGHRTLYGRLYSSFGNHRKALMAGDAALGLWVRMLSWTIDNTEAGVIPTPILEATGGKGWKVKADQLVRVGLWDVHPDGYAFHQWSDYQNPASYYDKKADADAERQRIRRGRTTDVTRDNPRDITPDVTGMSYRNTNTNTKGDHVSGPPLVDSWHARASA